MLQMQKLLAGKVAIVTGASRGAGRGIALVLGEAGATVYVTGRSVRGDITSEFAGTSIEETAEMIEARGGNAIPVQVDHTVDAQVEALFKRVQEEQGRLDLLVNNAWGGYEVENNRAFSAPFWEQPLVRWHKMIDTGLNAAMLAAYFAAPLMLPHRSGLIVNATSADAMDPELKNAIWYWLTKRTVNRMAYGFAHDLKPHNVAAVAVSPGWMRTEAVLANVDRGLHKPEEMEWTESVEFVGRAILALALDPDIMAQTGRFFTVRELSEIYGFEDIPWQG
jgi:NAD(P)-dependent dehydrogenase (short-subunit alcohol dehydrogenase family)